MCTTDYLANGRRDFSKVLPVLYMYLLLQCNHENQTIPHISHTPTHLLPECLIYSTTRHISRPPQERRLSTSTSRHSPRKPTTPPINTASTQPPPPSVLKLHPQHHTVQLSYHQLIYIKGTTTITNKPTPSTAATTRYPVEHSKSILHSLKTIVRPIHKPYASFPKKHHPLLLSRRNFGRKERKYQCKIDRISHEIQGRG